MNFLEFYVHPILIVQVFFGPDNNQTQTCFISFLLVGVRTIISQRWSFSYVLHWLRSQKSNNGFENQFPPCFSCSSLFATVHMKLSKCFYEKIVFIEKIGEAVMIIKKKSFLKIFFLHHATVAFWKQWDLHYLKKT